MTNAGIDLSLIANLLKPQTAGAVPSYNPNTGPSGGFLGSDSWHMLTGYGSQIGHDLAAAGLRQPGGGKAFGMQMAQNALAAGAEQRSRAQANADVRRLLAAIYGVDLSGAPSERLAPMSAESSMFRDRLGGASTAFGADAASGLGLDPDLTRRLKTMKTGPLGERSFSFNPPGYEP